MTRARVTAAALMLGLALPLSACSIAVPIPDPEPLPGAAPSVEPVGPASVYFSPELRGFILKDPGPPPLAPRSYRAALGPALLQPLKEACAPLFSSLNPVSGRELRKGDRWLLSFDNLVVQTSSGENEPCQVRIFLQYAVSDGNGRVYLGGLLDALGTGTEHRGALRYSESLGAAIRRSLEKLCRDLRKTLVARRGTFDDRKPDSGKASPG